jgi:hypothetical protein
VRWDPVCAPLLSLTRAGVMNGAPKYLAFNQSGEEKAKFLRNLLMM